MRSARRQPSLHRRLLLGLLVPTGVMAVALGAGGSLLIHEVVQATSDRLLDGSVLAIAERIAVEDGELTVDLPRVALGMLDTSAHDSVYYGVTYQGAPVTGYGDLPLPDVAAMTPGKTAHRDAPYRGVPVRIAAEARRIYGRPAPVLVQVAQTVNARRALERELLLGLAALEAALLGLVGLAAWLAVDRGLAPLARLSAEIDARAVRGAVNLRPLDLSTVPREALAPAVALNALLGRLEQSIGPVRRFTADASHQMRTPLAILRTHLDLVRRAGPLTAAATAALDDIEGAILRLERLVGQLLALARADEQGEETPATTVDLAALAADLAAERVPQALAAGVELELERPDGPVAVAGEPVLVRELLGNLVENAIRYNRPGGTVVVRVVRERAAARAEVEDDGPGIPAAERARVFERFYRTPRRDGPEGSGLGLAIVRAAADRLGATVGLADRPAGPGLLATVRFRVPAERGAVVPAADGAAGALGREVTRRPAG